MKKQDLLLKEEINRINEMAGRSPIMGKHLVVIDIQPEYQDGFDGWWLDFANYINRNFSKLSRLTFMFNGSNTVGSMDESQYRFWLIENGIKERVLEEADFFDKGYAFFRYCIDNNIEENQIVNLVKFMVEENINDSRDITEDFWNQFIQRYGNEDVRALIELSDDCVFIPDLMDEIRPYNNLVLCGGGINECMKEVEIALKALNKPYNVLTQFTY
jgi:hypothetical protein